MDAQWRLGDIWSLHITSFIMMLADKTRHCPAFLDLAYLILQSRVTAVEKSTCSWLKRTRMLPRKDRFQIQGLRHLYYFIGGQLEFLEIWMPAGALSGSACSCGLSFTPHLLFFLWACLSRFIFDSYCPCLSSSGPGFIDASGVQSMISVWGSYDSSWPVFLIISRTNLLSL